jgi:sugar O-acyltransferase (sialic acid O-acetyltransferase NeuD family)
MMEKIILLGGGGHCTSCIEVLESSGQWSILGFVDVPENRGRALLGYPFLGSDDDLPSLTARCKNVLVTVGQVRFSDVRSRLFERGKNAGCVFPVVTASSAIVSRRAEIGEGTIVMHRAFVNAKSIIGRNCIINTSAAIEHDAVIGDHCHVSTGALVNGGCIVGSGCLIGSGAVLLQGRRVVDGCIVGAGSVVVHSLEEPGVYVGCPARKIA